MRLTISTLAAAVVLHWTTPGAGSFWVFAADDAAGGGARVVAAGYEAVGCHWSLRVPVEGGAAIYWTAFWPAPAAIDEQP